ncbi:MAG: MoaD/ThiS family protein [Anaerolineae bacterium]
MSITVIPVGSLRQHVGGTEKVTLEFEGKTVLQVLANLGIPSAIVSAVLVNDVLVPKDHVPQDGDEVKLISVVGGG